MGESRFAEPFLRRRRFTRTLHAARNFDERFTPGASADGQEFFDMRSAMDLRPTAGKEMSRKALIHSRGGVPTEDLARTSTFVAFDEIDACVTGLEQDGVYVFRQLMPSTMVHPMLDSALTVPAAPRGRDAVASPFPRSSPTVGRYDIDENDTMASPQMQDFCSDPALALIAARYLGQPVIQDQTALWWTTTQGAADASMNAWLFHQDRDRLSFVKFFCYLTDVGPENGPHTMVRGTHKRVPRAMSRDGRKTDEAVRAAGLWDQVTELTGPAGTVLAVDTVGLHKGQPPISGDRCVLQVEFATSLFGAHVDYPRFDPTDLSRERFAQEPQLLQRWYRSFTDE